MSESEKWNVTYLGDHYPYLERKRGSGQMERMYVGIGEKRAKRLAKQLNMLGEAMELLREFAACEPAWNDERLTWVEVRLEKGELSKARQLVEEWDENWGQQ